MSQRIEIMRLAGALGAELRGLDLANKLDDESVEAIRAALYEHKVIFIRAQSLSPQQHVDFSAQLGPVFTDHPAYSRPSRATPRSSFSTGRKAGELALATR
jgi:taurine dioxygenase